MNRLFCSGGIIFISVIAVVTYSYLLINFVVNDTISSFSSDSANYIVMARYLSPWQTPTTPVLSAWVEQDFPLLFPLVLGIIGVAYNYVLSHLLVAIFLICSFPLIYYFSRQIRLDQITSIIIVIVFALSPAAWVNSLGILSENLYILLSVVTLCFYTRLDQNDKVQLFIFGILLALVVLTRTIGVALLGAYLLITSYHFIRTRCTDFKPFIPAAIATVIIVTVSLLQNKIVPDQYINQMLGLLVEETGQSALQINIFQQVTALTDAWLVSWLYYWNDNVLIASWFFAAVGVLGLIGLIYRIRLLELDALYLAIYLIILVFWPHPGQAVRFIYPVLFLLLLNAFFLVSVLLGNRGNKVKNYTIAFILIMSLLSVAPAQLYTYHRYAIGKELGYEHYKEFYISPDLQEAKYKSEAQAAIYSDLVNMRSMTDKDDRIMYFITAYVALLADRVGVTLGFYRDEAGGIILNRDEHADYVYLSQLHPRMTRSGINGLNLMPYFNGWTTPVSSTYSRENKELLSLTLRVNQLAN